MNTQQTDLPRDNHPANDYQPHLAYYHRATALSFVWSGGDSIAVCHGGYGEPVEYWIAAPAGMDQMPTREAMDRLQAAAEAHALADH